MSEEWNSKPQEIKDRVRAITKQMNLGCGLASRHASIFVPCQWNKPIYLGTLKALSMLDDEQIRAKIKEKLAAAGNPAPTPAKPRGFRPGENNLGARLTRAQVEEARALYQSGETCSALAQRCGVPYNTMWSVVKGVNWKGIS